jgi:hypothetical protein
MFSRQGIKVIEFMEIKTRLNRTKAFAVRINYEDKGKIFNPANWAKDVVIKISKYFPKDTYQENTNNKSSPNANATGVGRK